MSESAQETKQPIKEVIPPAYKRLSLVVALLIVATTLFLTFTAWELGISINGLSSKVISAEFNFAQAQIVSQAQARQNYVIYSSYLVNQRLAQQLGNDAQAAEAYPALLEQANLLAANSLYFFPSRYLNTDGSYDFDRNASELMADLGRRETLDSAPLRETVDSALQRKLAYQQVQLILGVALAILAFEEVFYWRRLLIRIPLIIFGIGLFSVGLAQYFLLNPNPLTAFLR